MGVFIDTVFLKILDMSFMASWLMIAVMLLRLLLKKAPKWIVCMLWILVGVRLICPFSLESAWSLIPSSEPVSELIRSGIDSSGSDMSESGIQGTDIFGTDIFAPDMPEGNRVETDMSEGSTSDMDRFQVNPVDMNETGTITPAADVPEIDAAESVNPEHMSIGSTAEQSNLFQADGHADSSAGYQTHADQTESLSEPLAEFQTGGSDGRMSGDLDDMTSSVIPLDSIISILGAAWITGVALMLLYGFISYYRLHRMTAVSMAVNVGADAETDANLGKNARLNESTGERKSENTDKNVFQCDAIDTPFILGIIRPRIYLPSHMEDSWTDYVIAHEKAHIRRRDHWWKPLGFLILSVYWFNPFCWLSYILLCRDIELACDESVIRTMDADSKKIYAKALLSCSVKQKMITACPLAFGEVGIKERIRGVMNYKKPAFWIVAVSFIACIVVAVCFLTEPKMTVGMEDSESQITDASGENEETDKNEEVNTSPEIEETDAAGFEYEYNERLDGISITGYIGDDTSVIIPKMIDGSPVVEINYRAFWQRANIISITIPDSVTTISSSAFSDCTSLTGITIPNSVTYMGPSVFAGCSSLESVTISDSVTSIERGVFSSCTSLTDITLPDSIAFIGDWAFKGCTSLTDIAIPDSVTYIGDSVFADCSRLTNIELPDSLTSMGNRVFENCDSLTDIKLPGSIAVIGYDMFSNCKSLTNITISDGIVSINGSAFMDCINLTDITIPDSVAAIGSEAFGNCSSLTNITLPDNVVFIGRSAFAGCSSLNGVVIPENMAFIGSNAFSGCSSLTSITLPDSINFIGEDAFSGCDALTVIYKDRAYDVSNNDSLRFEDLYAQFETSDFHYTYNAELKGWSIDGYGYYLDSEESIVIPGAINNNPITCIGRMAFKDSGMTDITLPDGIRYIDVSAFLNSSLRSITLPESLVYIGDSAFCRCYFLADVTLPEHVTYIGEWAFSGCPHLTSLNIPDSVTFIGENAFNSCDNLTVTYKGQEYTSDNFEDLYGLFSNVNPGVAAENDIEYLYDEESGYKYFYDEEAEGVVITEYAGDEVSVVIPEMIGNKSVIRIEDNTFEKCDIANLTIPNSVMSMGNLALYGCDHLTAITIPGRLVKFTDDGNMLYGCSSITDVTLLDGTAAVLIEQFRSCHNLKSITIPDSVISIHEYAFADCSSLTSVIISERVVVIGKHAFENCTSLEEIIIPDSVKYIYAGAFMNCSSLTSVRLSNRITYISNGLFVDCRSLTNIDIPDGVTSIGGSAFDGCTGLKEITIPDSVTSIRNFAFMLCSSLESITIPDGVTSIEDFVFAYCENLKEITIPDSVRSIGDCAFFCSGIESITMSNSVTSLGRAVFQSCSSLESIIIPDSVTSIDRAVFRGCDNLTVTYGGRDYKPSEFEELYALFN